MATTKKVNIFALNKILDIKTPFLELDGFGDTPLTFYHPNDLPKSATLKIVQSNENRQYIQDQTTLLIQENDKLDAEIEAGIINKELPNIRRDLIRQVAELQKQLQQESIAYLDILAKLKPGELLAKIDALYAPKTLTRLNDDGEDEEYESLDHIPQFEKEEIIEKIIEQVNLALGDWNKTETNSDKPESKGFEKSGNEVA